MDQYGKRTTVYNRFKRWSRRGFWHVMLAALAKAGWPRCPAASAAWPPTKATMPTGCAPACAARASRRSSPASAAAGRRIRHDKRRYREPWSIEATFNRLKDFRRIATRSDKVARNYASALALAAVIAFW